LKQELSSWATIGLTEEACWFVARRESKSEVVALGLGLDADEEWGFRRVQVVA
jgi:hypothetical protein